jgi:hypothetical protein
MKPAGFLLWWHPTDIPEGKRNRVIIRKMEILYNKRSLSFSLWQT